MFKAKSLHRFERVVGDVRRAFSDPHNVNRLDFRERRLPLPVNRPTTVSADQSIVVFRKERIQIIPNPPAPVGGAETMKMDAIVGIDILDRPHDLLRHPIIGEQIH